jgi:multidrug efflux pump
MISRFFIDRPIFASVVSIVMTVIGAIALLYLPIAQYPRITPPGVSVSINYPGASAKIVADTVAAPIEQQVNGVEDMIYMASQSGNDGSYSLSVTFKPGVNLNFAQVLVQNRVNLALPLLPDVVKQAGVTTRKRNPDILLIVSLYSPNHTYDQFYLSNFATLYCKDELARVEGVGDVFLFGQQDYSMRVWVDPDRLGTLNLTAGDVVSAIREQNQQVAAGHVGQPPASAGQTSDLPVSTLGRLSEPEEFANIVLRTAPDGRKVRIKDVGKVRTGPRNEDVTSKIDGDPCTSLAVFQLPYANAIDTADNVRRKMDELKKNFPDDVDYKIAYDTTPFISESIREVFRTLGEAVALVALVVLVFLQSWRSTLIPLVAVPVAIVGTFAAMAALGFSINNLTLFGMVLAIGIVVDDAIVVVEAVEHHIEEGLRPRKAAYRAMEQVSGPVMAVALVLSAVFIPCAFISGITGQFFRQFALTIAVSTIISAFNSLTLSPALAAILLRPRKKGTFEPMPRLVFALVFGGLAYFAAVQWLAPSVPDTALPGLYAITLRQATPWAAAAVLAVVGMLLAPPLNVALGGFFRLFDWSFRRVTSIYTRVVGLALRGSAVVLVVYGGLMVLTWWTFNRLPTGYIPNQDSRRLFAAVQLPDSASLERTQEVVDLVSRIAQGDAELGGKYRGSPPAPGSKLYKGIDGVDHTIAVAGQSFTLSANGSNFGNLFITLDDFSKPGGEKRSSDDIITELQSVLDTELPKLGKSAVVKVLGPPPVSGLGSSGGFKFIVEDRSGDNDLVKLQKQTERFIAASRPKPPTQDGNQDGAAGADAVQAAAANKVAGLFTVFRANSPQLYVDLNRKQCQTMGVNPNDVFTTLQVYLGSFYVNDFNKFGRTWQVVVQAEGQFRNDLDQVKRQKVRSAGGNMVPLGAVLDIREIEGPLLLTRYNMYPAAAVVGNTAPGVSSGDGINAMERLAGKTLPKQSMGYEWTEINFIQVDAAKNIWNNLIFPLAVVFVFLVLAAQYESWALPLAVILVVPMCLLGSLTGVAATRSAVFTSWCANVGVHIAPSDINIFTQIGFVVLVGLASKNAILIVEFAKHKVEEGLSRREATLAACQLRLRPILMTSFAFILGVVPLILASGAGHEMRQTLGTAVFSGMLGVTLFGIFLTPVFFSVIEWFLERPVFATERVRMYGKVLGYGVGVASLGLIWLVPMLARVLRHRRAAAAQGGNARRPTIATDGNGGTARDGDRQSDGIQADQGPRRVPRM